MSGAGRAREKIQPQDAPAEVQTTALPLEERVRRRAYEIYLQRGGQDGSDTDDWLQAEEEIQRETEDARSGSTVSDE